MKTAKSLTLRAAFCIGLLFCMAQPAVAQLHGTYTIDPSKSASASNYKDIASAISDLENGTRSDGGTAHGAGISANVIFKLADGTYKGRYMVHLISGVSLTSQVTFTSASGDNTKVTLEYDFNGNSLPDNNWAIFSFHNAQQIILDHLGFYAGGTGCTRSFGMVSVIDVTRGMYVSNCRFINASNDGNISGVVVSDTSWAGIDSLISVKNNYFKNTDYCFRMEELTGKYYNSHIYFSSNTADNVNHLFFSRFSNDVVIDNNYAASVKQNGIKVIISSNVHSISGNRIYMNGTPASVPTLGLTLDSIYNPSSSSLLSNNVISNEQGLCMLISGVRSVNIYHNTFNYKASLTPGYKYGYQKINYNAPLWIDAYAKNVNIENNIFSVTGSVALKPVCMLLGSLSSLNTCDYNDYNCPDSFAHADSTYRDLKAWLLKTGFDTHSIDANPGLNLSHDYKTGNSALAGMGTPLSLVMYDVLNVSRSTTAPTIGAYENIQCYLTLDAGPDKMVCNGDSVEIGPAPDTSLSYTWTSIPTSSLPNSAKIMVKPSKKTTYILTAEDNATGCMNTDTVIVSVDTSIAKFSCKDIICAGDTLYVSDSSTGAVSYSWDFDGTATSTAKNPAHVFTAGGYSKIHLYTLSVNGCSGYATKPVFVDTACVWPGDANYDKKTAISDVLAIGLAYGDTGGPRPDTTTLWYAHPAYDWSKSFKSGANHKHADCNGDGVVDKKDLKAIVRNYAKTHPKAGGSGNPADPALALVINKDSVSVKDTLTIDMELGSKANPVKDIYGLCFSISYNPQNINAAKGIIANMSKCWMGTPDKDLVYLLRNDSINGQIDIGICRTDQKAISGYGSIGILSVIMPDNVAGKIHVKKEIYFGLSNVTAISNTETLIPLYTLNDSASLFQYLSINNVISESGITIYPNPVHSTLQVSCGLLRPLGIQVTNLTGQQIILPCTINGNMIQVSTSAIPAGVYTLTVTTDKGIVRKQFIRQ